MQDEFNAFHLYTYVNIEGEVELCDFTTVHSFYCEHCADYQNNLESDRSTYPIVFTTANYTRASFPRFYNALCPHHTFYF